MNQENSDTASDTRQWWVSTTGKPEGPFAESDITARLKANTISANAHACPVGGQEWKPLAQWPEFADAVVPTPPATPAVPPPDAAAASAPMLTNPQLPAMANWICVYALLVAPFMWCVYELSCCTTFVPTFRDDSAFFVFELGIFFFDTIVSIAVVILLLVGGFRLKNLRRSGVRFVKVAIWISLGSLPLLILMFALLGIVGAVAGEHHFAEETSTTAQELIDFMFLIVGLAELTFQIIALFWLYRNARNLPLTET